MTLSSLGFDDDIFYEQRLNSEQLKRNAIKFTNLRPEIALKKLAESRDGKTAIWTAEEVTSAASSSQDANPGIRGVEVDNPTTHFGLYDSSKRDIHHYLASVREAYNLVGLLQEAGVKGMKWGVRHKVPVVLMLGTNGAGKSTIMKNFANRYDADVKNISGEKWTVVTRHGEQALIMGSYQKADPGSGEQPMHSNAGEYFRGRGGEGWGHKLMDAIKYAEDNGMKAVLVDTHRLAFGRNHDRFIKLLQHEGVAIKPVRVKANAATIVKRVADRIEPGHTRNRTLEDIATQHVRVKQAFNTLRDQGWSGLKIANEDGTNAMNHARRLGKFVFAGNKKSGVSESGLKEAKRVSLSNLHPTQSLGYKRRQITKSRQEKANKGHLGRPLKVRKKKSGSGYDILDGHHRYLMAKKAGVKSLKVHEVKESRRFDEVAGPDGSAIHPLDSGEYIPMVASAREAEEFIVGGEFHSNAGMFESGVKGQKWGVRHKKERSERSKSSYIPVTKEKYALAMKNQARLAKALGGEEIHDNKPFDVIMKSKVAIEVKTLLEGKNDKITVHPDSKARKDAAAKKHGLKVFTVAFDNRDGKKDVYVKEGVGAFRLSGMTKTSLSKIKDIIK